MPSASSAGSVGPIVKALSVARSLRARGCQVRFVIGGHLAELISRNGFEVAFYPVPRPAWTVQPINNIVDFMHWAGMTDPDFIETGVEAEIVAIREFHPDVIFAEARPSAAISATAMCIPLVNIVSWPVHPEFPPNQECGGQFVDGFNRQLRRYGLSEIKNIAELVCLRGDVQLAPTIPELEPELQALPGINFVGAMVNPGQEDSGPPTWYPGWPQKPLIFIYMSIAPIPPEVYLPVVSSTFEGLPFDVLCACGFHRKLRYLPPSTNNIRFERYVPAYTMMKHTCLVIFHGGQNTMMTTLLHGLPSLTIPGQHFERTYNAMQLSRRGASKMLAVQAFRPRRLQAAVMEVLNGCYAIESQKLAQKLWNYRGREQAADAILSAAHSAG